MADVSVDQKLKADEFEAEAKRLFKKKDLEGLKHLAAYFRAQSSASSGDDSNALVEAEGVAQVLANLLEEQADETQRVASRVGEDVITEHKSVGGDRTKKFVLSKVLVNDSIPERQDIVEGAVIPITRFEDDWMTQMKLFIRTNLVHHFKNVSSFMDDNDADRMYASGAEGCGKTCFFWMLAGMLMKQGKNVLFIQYRTFLACQIWVLDGEVSASTMKRVTFPFLKTKTLDDTVVDLVLALRRKFDVCICDGLQMHEQYCKDLLQALIQLQLRGETEAAKISKISKLILVSSLQFTIRGGESHVAANDPSIFISLDSWREEDYCRAIKSDLVKDPFVRNTLLQDWLTLKGVGEDGEQPTDEQKMEQAVILKYHLAGGCARYMFQWTVETVLTNFKRWFQMIPRNEWASFTHTYTARSTDSVVDSFMQQFSIGPNSITCFAVSKYVLLRAHMECRNQLTRAMHRLGEATNNLVLKGWAFELDQLDQIQFALEANRERIGTVVRNSALTFVPQAETTFDGLDMIHGATGAPVGKVVNNSFIRCLKSNQSCFDAALYFDETIVTLHFTCSHTHTLKLEYLKPLYYALVAKGAKIKQFVHLCIVDEQALAVESFQFDLASTERVTCQTKDDGIPVVLTKSGSLTRVHLPSAKVLTSEVAKDGTTHYLGKLC